MSKLEELIQELCPNGVEYKPLSEIFTREKSKGKSDISIKQVYVVSNNLGLVKAEEYRENTIHSDDTSNYTIVRKGRAGADYRASIGKIYGCAPIFGYDRVGSGKNSHIVINEAESKAVKTIFNMYLRGHGYKAIANYLNKSGTCTKKGNLFAISTIRSILESPLYVGMIRYNLFKNWNVKRRRGRQDDDSYILVDGLHENIISRTKWDKVQTKLKESKGTRKNVIYGRFPLNSILKCPECGSGMAGMTTRYQTKKGIVERRAYVCSKYQNKGKIACGINSIKAIDIENSVFSILDNFFQKNRDNDIIQRMNPDYIREIIFSNDGQSKRKLMKKFIKSISIEDNGRKILGMDFIINEELFDFLNVKYTEKNATELSKFMETFVCTDSRNQ